MPLVGEPGLNQMPLVGEPGLNQRPLVGEPRFADYPFCPKGKMDGIFIFLIAPAPGQSLRARKAGLRGLWHTPYLTPAQSGRTSPEVRGVIKAKKSKH